MDNLYQLSCPFTIHNITNIFQGNHITFEF